ncbi:MAG: hypothetical protein WAX22_03025 [Lactococcus hircilactis]|uniref:hypothetical protein n=1 Tax=Lactococcus hircilactis TaxID=1494462 RepID=UPI003BDD8D94
MKLYRFEFKKFCKNKRNVVLFLALSFLVFFSFYFIVVKSFITPSFLITQQINIKQQEISELQSGQSMDTLDQKKNRAQKIQIDTAQITALEAKKINRYYQLEFKSNQIALKDSSNSAQTIAQLTSENDYIQLVQKRHLNFEISPSNQLSAFSSFISFGLVLFFSSLFLLGFSLFVSTELAIHFENKENRYYSFAHISPLKTVLSKISAPISVTFLWILGISTLFIILFGFLYGFNSLNYPAYLMNQWGPSAETDVSGLSQNIGIPVGQVIVISLLYLLLLLFFLSSVGALLSTLTHRSMVVVGMIAILIVGWSLAMNLPYVQSFRRFIPMSYLNPLELMCHPSYLAGKFSLIVGVSYLLLLSLGCLFSAIFLLKQHHIRRI